MILENANIISARATFNAVLGGGYCTEYQTIYDQFISTPSEDDANAQNTFVKALVDGGIWSELDRLWILASHASGADSLLDWIHPTVSGNIASVVNGPTWTKYQGYVSDGTTKYLNLNYDPSTDGENFISVLSTKTNSCSMGAYSRGNDLTINRRSMGGQGSSSQSFILPYRSGATRNLMLNDCDQYSVAITPITGMFAVNTIKTTSHETFAELKEYKDGSEVLSSLDAYSDVTNGEIYGLCQQYSGGPVQISKNQHSMFYIGGNLTGPQHLIFYNAFQALMTYYGTQV